MHSAEGKTILVTGATNGLGLQASIALARLGARVLLVGRDPARTEQALGLVRSAGKSGTAASYLCDFRSQAQIRALAATIQRNAPKIDVLVNNAGALFPRRSVSEDGIESTFAVNHLGYFLLTALLLGPLQAGATGARVVNVASSAHHMGSMNLKDPGAFPFGYGTFRAYARSKLANILFTRELARRLGGSRITANCLHPGVVATGLWENTQEALRPLTLKLSGVIFTPPEKAAQRIVYLAADPSVQETSGQYFAGTRPGHLSWLAKNDALAGKLWDRSCDLVGLPRNLLPLCKAHSPREI